jgi:ornithine carbamoyltransferase
VYAIRPSSTLDPLPWGTPEAVLGQARALQSAARFGTPRSLLRGKHLGLLCRDADSPAARLFRDAAAELGARVSQVAPTLLEADTVPTIGEVARVLGRLYDALECQGLPAPLVEGLRAHAGIPVFAGIATADHPSLALAAGLDGPDIERRRLVLQAALIVSLS